MKIREDDDQQTIDVVADSNSDSMADDQKTVQVITQIESDATMKALEATSAIAKAKFHKNLAESEKYAETLNAQ